MTKENVLSQIFISCEFKPCEYYNFLLFKLKKKTLIYIEEFN